ncbi:hypothetical protein IMZ48_42640 [Candidatus Bathyarchaeota archaeon]|nr:hypothetical protein [Candidatus Bathyarchaeota archaeon]
MVVAVGAYWFVQNYPTTASFITEKERVFIHERLASDSDATLDEEFTWAAVIDALKDPKCWLYGLGFHSTSLPLYTFSLFLVRDSPSVLGVYTTFANTSNFSQRSSSISDTQPL